METANVSRACKAVEVARQTAYDRKAADESFAERWEAALLTWRQVHALAPASRKRETGGALLRVLERLGKDDEATRLLLSQIDAQTETREQINGFQELLAYCEKRRLLPWLRTEFEQRRKMRADDYFTGMALGRILKAQGDKAGAFDLFAEVSLAAPNQAEALPELVREAEELRRGAVAIRLQSQLVRVVPQTRPDGFEKLAQLQEKNFDIEEAARTWTRIVMRFPRDPAALEHAVDFELKWGIPTRATQLLHRVCQIDPGNLKALFTLADLHADAGALVEARACLEEFLLRSQPEKPGDPLRFPKVGAAGRFQNGYLPPAWLLPNKTKSGLPRDRWIEEPVGKSELDWRLAVIRDLAMLVRESKDPGAMTNWVERWEKASLQSPGEALWALFYAGEHGPLFDLLARLMERSEFHLQTRQAFVWLTLHTRQFDRLASWLQDPKRTLAERDYLFGSGSGGMGGGGGYGGMGTGSGAPGHAGSVPGSWGAGSMGWAAASGGATGSLSGGAGLLGMCIGGLEGTEPLLFEKLFSKGYRLRRWQAAMHFANRTRFREAVQLGLPIFEASITQRADYGFEVAQWHIYLGDIGNARRLLADSMAQPGES
ncbi:MAG: tetratricopeptide repeat protein, partial [Verrucomicrobiota bacterium]